MTTFEVVLLAISTVASAGAVTISYLALGRSNQAAFHQYKALALSNLEDRRRKVEEIGYLIEDAAAPAGYVDQQLIIQARRHLPHALVGYQYKFPNCTDMANPLLTAEVPLDAARCEVQRELSVIGAAAELPEARRIPEGRVARWLHRNRSALPFPDAVAP